VLADRRLTRLPRPRDVERADSVLANERCQPAGCVFVTRMDVEPRLPVLRGEFRRLLRSRAQRRLDRDDHRAIRIEHVLLGSLGIALRLQLRELVLRRYLAILSPPAFRARVTMRDAACDGPIQCRM